MASSGTRQVFEKVQSLSPSLTPQSSQALTFVLIQLWPGSLSCLFLLIGLSRITKPLFPILLLLVQLSLVEGRSGVASPGPHGQLFSEYLRHECVRGGSLGRRQAWVEAEEAGRGCLLFFLDIS